MAGAIFMSDDLFSVLHAILLIQHRVIWLLQHCAITPFSYLEIRCICSLLLKIHRSDEDGKRILNQFDYRWLRVSLGSSKIIVTNSHFTLLGGLKREFQIHNMLWVCDNGLEFFCNLHQTYEFSTKDCKCNGFLNRKKGLLRNALTIISHDVVSMILRGGQKQDHLR